MTIETAERAKHILEELKDLEHYKKSFEETPIMEIHYTDSDKKISYCVECDKERNKNSIYFYYIINGMSKEIARLKEELIRL